jgi:murein L,D-transpeptidase YafK
MSKKYLLLIGLSFIIACSAFVEQEEEKPSFREEQFKFPRVREAFEINESYLEAQLLVKSIKKSEMELYLRAFKLEGIVEIWAKNRNDKTFQLIANYKFCENSGSLGPKRQQGDNQIPEGYYNISQFNPASNFYLSLKISYPNKSDSVLGVKGNYGGQIYLHGGCATIGCVPITDTWIGEAYVLCVMAKEAGQKNIPMHIFPARLNRANMESLEKDDYPEVNKALWRDLKKGYEYFERTGQKPEYSISSKGRYILSKN